MTYAYVWMFEVKSGCEDEFRKIYGMAGAWVKLFEKSKGYLKTELHQDLRQPRTYLTIDYWESAQANQFFRQQHDDEFVALDHICEALTVKENFVGEFELVTPHSIPALLA